MLREDDRRQSAYARLYTEALAHAKKTYGQDADIATRPTMYGLRVSVMVDGDEVAEFDWED